MLSILGLSYEGIESGNITYWGYLISLLIFSILFYIYKKLKDQTISKKELTIIYFLILFVVYTFSYNILNGMPINHLVRQVILFFIFTLPALISGYYFSYNKNRISELSKILEVIMIIFTLGLFSSTFSTLITGESFESIGGSTYQEASYLAAYSFGINLFYLIWGDKVSRYNIFKKNGYKFLQILMLVIQLFSLVVGGGRGAFLLLIAYLLTYTGILLKQANYKLIFKSLMVSLIFILFIVVFTQTFLNDTQIVSSGINRILEFVSPEGINWEGTSGRDIVYRYILNTFKENPVLGVGFFNYHQPHNLFLEVLVSIGVAGFSMFLFLLFCFLVKFSKILSKNFENIIILVIFLYPLIMLMFSGSIFMSPEFSFVVSFVVFFRLEDTYHVMGSNVNRSYEITY